MADTREIIITIRGSGDSFNNASGNNVATAKDITSKTGEIGGFGGETGGGEVSSSTGSSAYAAMAISLAREAANDALGVADYFVERQFTLTDDYIGKRTMNVASQMISKSVARISKIASYTAMGAQAGPYGAIAGAIIGAVAATADVFLDNFKGADQQNIQIRKMEAQLDYTRKRAGWSSQAASIGEDL